jgi:hypothetical protein
MSGDVREGERSLKGYKQMAHWDAWQRYLVPSPSSSESATCATRTKGTNSVADSADVAHADGDGSKAI